MEYSTSSVWKEFDENKVTHSIVHYLFAIESLIKKNGYARAVDIAKKLDITPGSCSVGVKSLLKKGFIHEDENKFVRLSEMGEETIVKTKRTRNTFKKFFEQNLGVDTKTATVNACKIEHLIDEEITIKLEKMI